MSLFDLPFAAELESTNEPKSNAPGRSNITSRLRPRPQIFLMQEGGGFAPISAARAQEVVERASGGAGEPLPGALRDRFESSLGVDLAPVRVHTGAASATAAKTLQARAYATGNDIHFAPGQYQPEDPFGMHLLAHEVAHTVQQDGQVSAPQHKLEISAPGDACEHEADRAADAMIEGRAASVSPAGVIGRQVIQRDDDGSAPPAAPPAADAAAAPGTDGAPPAATVTAMATSVKDARAHAQALAGIAAEATRARTAGDAVAVRAAGTRAITLAGQIEADVTRLRGQADTLEATYPAAAEDPTFVQLRESLLALDAEYQAVQPTVLAGFGGAGGGGPLTASLPGAVESAAQVSVPPAPAAAPDPEPEPAPVDAGETCAPAPDVAATESPPPPSQLDAGATPFVQLEGTRDMGAVTPPKGGSTEMPVNTKVTTKTPALMDDYVQDKSAVPQVSKVQSEDRREGTPGSANVYVKAGESTDVRATYYKKEDVNWRLTGPGLGEHGYYPMSAESDTRETVAEGGVTVKGSSVTAGGQLTVKDSKPADADGTVSSEARSGGGSVAVSDKGVTAGVVYAGKDDDKVKDATTDGSKSAGGATLGVTNTGQVQVGGVYSRSTTGDSQPGVVDKTVARPGPDKDGNPVAPDSTVRSTSVTGSATVTAGNGTYGAQGQVDVGTGRSSAATDAPGGLQPKLSVTGGFTVTWSPPVMTGERWVVSWVVAGNVGVNASAINQDPAAMPGETKGYGASVGGGVQSGSGGAKTFAGFDEAKAFFDAAIVPKDKLPASAAELGSMPKGTNFSDNSGANVAGGVSRAGGGTTVGGGVTLGGSQQHEFTPQGDGKVNYTFRRAYGGGANASVSTGPVSVSGGKSATRFETVVLQFDTNTPEGAAGLQQFLDNGQSDFPPGGYNVLSRTVGESSEGTFGMQAGPMSGTRTTDLTHADTTSINAAGDVQHDTYDEGKVGTSVAVPFAVSKESTAYGGGTSQVNGGPAVSTGGTATAKSENGGILSDGNQGAAVQIADATHQGAVDPTGSTADAGSGTGTQKWAVKTNYTQAQLDRFVDDVANGRYRYHGNVGHAAAADLRETLAAANGDPQKIQAALAAFTRDAGNEATKLIDESASQVAPVDHFIQHEGDATWPGKAGHDTTAARIAGFVRDLGTATVDLDTLARSIRAERKLVQARIDNLTRANYPQVPPAEISAELGRNQGSAAQLDQLVARVDARRGVAIAEPVDAAHHKAAPAGVPEPEVADPAAPMGPPPPPPQHTAALIAARAEVVTASAEARGLAKTAQAKARAHRGENSTTASSLRERTGDKMLFINNEETAAYARADQALAAAEKRLRDAETDARESAAADPANPSEAVNALDHAGAALDGFHAASSSYREAIGTFDGIASRHHDLGTMLVDQSPPPPAAPAPPPPAPAPAPDTDVGPPAPIASEAPDDGGVCVEP